MVILLISCSCLALVFKYNFVCSTIIAHPEITHPPESKIVVENTQDVTFSCTATGSPPPEIAWIYRGSEVRPSNQDPRPENRTQNYSINSNLTFPSVSGVDSGEIRCIARIPPGPSTGDIRLNVTEAATHLSVLGESIIIICYYYFDYSIFPHLLRLG